MHLGKCDWATLFDTAIHTPLPKATTHAAIPPAPVINLVDAQVQDTRGPRNQPTTNRRVNNPPPQSNYGYLRSEMDDDWDPRIGNYDRRDTRPFRDDYYRPPRNNNSRHPPPRRPQRKGRGFRN